MDRRSLLKWLSAVPALSILSRSKLAKAAPSPLDIQIPMRGWSVAQTDTPNWQRVMVCVGLAPGDLKHKGWSEGRYERAPLIDRFKAAVEEFLLVRHRPVMTEPVSVKLYDKSHKVWAPCPEDPDLLIAAESYFREKNGVFEIIRPDLILRAVDMRRLVWRRSIGGQAPGMRYAGDPPTELQFIEAHFVVEPYPGGFRPKKIGGFEVTSEMLIPRRK